MWMPACLSLSKFNPMNCMILPIMPFLSNGKKHLTPFNAIDNLLLNVNADDFVFSFMITSTTETIFINKLQLLANNWSLPEFKKALRISKTLSTLDATKMIIPAIDKSLNSSQLSAPQTRLIQSAQKSGQIKSLSMNNIQSGITSFTEKQQQMINQIKSDATKAGDVKIDVYYYFGPASELKKDIPNQNHIFTFLICFVGADIVKLIDLIELPL